MGPTGTIRELKANEELKDNEILINGKPNKNCKDCYGRGFIKYIIENIIEIKPCHCVKLK